VKTSLQNVARHVTVSRPMQQREDGHLKAMGKKVGKKNEIDV